jgi:glycine cleavage system H protein
MDFPADLKYTDHDEWIRVDGQTITLGITAYAQSELGELVHVELPEVGATFEAGAAACEVESVKAVAEVFTPVAGTVVAVNEALDGAEETINDDPYGEGWLLQLEADDLGPLDDLMDAEAYKKKIDEA